MCSCSFRLWDSYFCYAVSLAVFSWIRSRKQLQLPKFWELFSLWSCSSGVFSFQNEFWIKFGGMVLSILLISSWLPYVPRPLPTDMFYFRTKSRMAIAESSVEEFIWDYCYGCGPHCKWIVEIELQSADRKCCQKSFQIHVSYRYRQYVALLCAA